MSAAFSDAGRALAHAPRHCRTQALAAAQKLRAELPPRTIVPLSPDEAKCVASFLLALKDLEHARAEADHAMRVLSEKDAAPFEQTLRAAAMRVQQLGEGLDLDMFKVARGVL